MPRTPKKAARYEPPDFVHAKKKKAKKKPAPKPKKKTVTHTDDGVPIVNASMAQIRKGLSGKAATQLVRIPQVAERSKFYVEAAEIIGERESHALPYHGGRMWKVEVKVSDDKGAYGDNCKGKGRRSNNNDDEDEDGKKKKKTNYNALTPLFRWYRGKLELATMPHILENIEEVEHNQSKAKWARGLKNIDVSDDDSSEEEEDWDDDKYIPESEKNFTMEISNLTTSAYEDTSHPLPDIRRTWISPDMQRFQSRKSAIAHAEKLTKKDLLIDRVMFGVGHNGVRLRPVKPTRKLALEAGEARFVRDGLWVVGQEEVWIAKRREIYVKKQEKLLKSQEQQQKEESTSAEEGGKATEAKKESEKVPPGNNEAKTTITQGEEAAATSDNVAKDDVKMEEAVQKVDTVVAVSSEELEKVAPESNGPFVEDRLQNDATGKSNDVQVQAKDNQSSDGSSKTITPVESDASTGDVPTTTTDDKPKVEDPPTKPKRVVRAPGTRPPPEFVPSTHYCLTQAQIDKCAAACNEHFEKVMDTVKARSLYHELADGFDVMRERGRGRYDMELSAFETKEFSFLTDTKKAAWMPIIHKILGEDALLVHKGCFLSLPGSESQVYHQDGLHLNKKVHKPCHAVNVFIPLIDMDISNGPTEFCLGTHYLGRENFVKDMVYTPCVTAGTPIIFDYRLGHRGLKNASEDTRPVVYLTYSAVKSGKEFRDEVNFSRKRYKKLGDFVEKKLPRGERLKKRRKVNPASTAGSAQEQNACIGIGSVVSVESRMWPGVNKPGGVGRVTKIHAPAGPEAEGFVKKYDIAYILGGKEDMVEEEYVSLPTDDAPLSRHKPAKEDSLPAFNDVEEEHIKLPLPLCLLIMPLQQQHYIIHSRRIGSRLLLYSLSNNNIMTRTLLSLTAALVGSSVSAFTQSPAFSNAPMTRTIKRNSLLFAKELSTYDIDTDENAEQSLADTPVTNGANGLPSAPQTVNGDTGNVDNRYASVLESMDLDIPSLKDLPSQRPISSNDVFCNRELRLDNIRAIGFDMDYTLAQYQQPNFDKLAFDGAKEKLVNSLGYPKEVLDFEYDHTYWVRGLIIDTARGNFLKIDRHKYVRVAYHGFSPISSTMRKQIYSRTFNKQPSFTEKGFVNMDTLFQHVDAHLFASLVEMKDYGEHEFLDERTYEEIYRQVRECVDLCHRDGVIKDEVARDPEKYLVLDDGLLPMLKEFRENGIKVFLLTNSYWEYTSTAMNYLYHEKKVDEETQKKNEWTELFDLVVVGACKPAYLKDPYLNLFRVVPEDGSLKNTDGLFEIEALGENGAEKFLEMGKCFQGGNWNHLQAMLGTTAGEEIIYVGDHLYADVLRSKRALGWRSCFIMPELPEEMRIFTSQVELRKSIMQLRSLRDELGAYADALRLEMKKASFSESRAMEKKIEQIEEDDGKIKEKLSAAHRQYHSAFHPRWGQMFVAGYQDSRFGYFVKNYACLYTSKATNLGLSSSSRAFRTSGELLPHDNMLSRPSSEFVDAELE